MKSWKYENKQKKNTHENWKIYTKINFTFDFTGSAKFMATPILTWVSNKNKED